MDIEKIIEELKRAGMTEEDAHRLVQKHLDERLKTELLAISDVAIEMVSSSIQAKMQS